MLAFVRASTRLWLTALIYTIPVAGALSVYIGRAGAAYNGWAITAVLCVYLFTLYLILAWIAQVRSGYGGMEKILGRLSEGDLDYRNEPGHRGAVWELVYQLNDMSSNLARIFERVRSSAEVIDTAPRSRPRRWRRRPRGWRNWPRR